MIQVTINEDIIRKAIADAVDKAFDRSEWSAPGRKMIQDQVKKKSQQVIKEMRARGELIPATLFKEGASSVFTSSLLLHASISEELIEKYVGMDPFADDVPMPAERCRSILRDFAAGVERRCVAKAKAEAMREAATKGRTRNTRLNDVPLPFIGILEDLAAAYEAEAREEQAK